MKIKLSFLVAVAGCLTAGCSTMSAGPKEPVKPVRTIQVVEGFNQADFTRPDRKDVHIYIEDGNYIVIDQEPIRRRANDTHALQWRLDRDQPYSFPDNKAIVLFGTAQYPLPVDLDCGTVGAKRKVFVCSYTRTGAARWKYSVRIKNDQTGNELPILDPTVHQE